MDWYIFLTPLLLLPIVFLFRLIGCGLDETGGAELKTITIRYDSIPAINPYPIQSLNFVIMLQYSDILPLQKPAAVLKGEPLPEGFIPVAEDYSVAPNWYGVSCSCYVYIKRYDFPYESEEEKEHGLKLLVEDDTTDYPNIDWILEYNGNANATDYLASDFKLSFYNSK